MKDIRKYMLESDLLVYATPTYWWGPSAQLKVVIDRSVAFFDERHGVENQGQEGCHADYLCGQIPRHVHAGP